MSHRLPGTVSCNRTRRCGQSVNQCSLAKAATHSSHQAQHRHPVSPYSMMPSTEFGDFPDDTFGPLSLSEQRDNAFGLNQSDAFLKTPTQTCTLEQRIDPLHRHLGNPDIISFDAHFEHRCIIRPQVKSAAATEIESRVMPVTGQ